MLKLVWLYGMIRDQYAGAVTLLCFLFLHTHISSYALNAQELRFKHLTIEDGLSQNSVHCMIQDRQGFMWFGTQDGLNRYDGYSFSVFRYDPAETSSVSNSWIQTLYEDRHGFLWVGTDGGGLNRFDRKTRTFRAFRHDPNDPSTLSHNRVWSVCEDRQGRLWIGTYGGGLNLYDTKTETFASFKNDPKDPASISENYVITIYEDRAGRIWVGTLGGGLNLFDADKKKFTAFINRPNDPSSLSDNRVRTIYEDHSGRLWIGTYSGLCLFKPESQTFKCFKNDPGNAQSLSYNSVFSIYEREPGRLWLGTFGGGLNSFDVETGTFRSYMYDPRDPSSLTDNSIYSLYEDRSGRLWAGTYSGGLNLYDPKSKAFHSYKNDPDNLSSLTDNRVRTIYEDRSGRLWVGTYGGINIYDPVTKKFTVLKKDMNDPSSLSENRVRMIYEDRSGRIWIGTSSGGLNLYDRETKKFKVFKNEPGDTTSLSNNSVWCIFQDQSGRVWVGATGGGLNLFDSSAMNFRVIREEISTSSNDAILSINDEDSGRLWLGTSGGLKLYDHATGRFTTFRNDPKDAHSLSSNRVRVIYKDHTGRLWLGTDGGLNLYEPGSKTFKVYRAVQGLANDVIYGILEDEQDRLWLSTNKGLSRFDPRNETFRNYDVTDGLLSNEFNQNAYFKGRDGMMYFGGIHGLNSFHPDSIKDDPYVPSVVLTAFEIFNKDVEVGKPYEGFTLPASITEADELILSYRESVFTLEFSALIFAQPLKNQYAYRLDGFDKNWIYTDAKRRFATYTNLDPGTYLFRVKGSNHDGVWNEEGRTLKIIITPPWWKTWWAYSLYGMFCVFAMVAFIQVRIRNERKKQEIRKAKELAAINADLQSAIKQLRETQAQLVQKEKMASLGQMTAGIAHEINNPLTFVHGNLDYFKQGFEKVAHLCETAQKASNDETRRAAVENLIQEISLLQEDMSAQLKSSLAGTNRIKEIVKNLRKFARVGESGAKETNVNADLEAIIDLFVKQHSGIHVERHFYEPLYITGDVSELNQCYLNILTNAVQAIRESEKQGLLETNSGVIAIRTEPVEHEQQKYIRLTFTDNGIGIPDENKNKIFDPFFTTRAIGQGRGLGLAETYGIIHKHGGTIEVHSEERKGSSFVITLPKDGVPS